MQRLIEDKELRAWLQESGLDLTANRSEFDIQKAALAILPRAGFKTCVSR
jgi:hypothetical protein